MSRIGKGGRQPGSQAAGVTPPSEEERQMQRVERGEVRIGPDAAREIAQKIEDEGGFWGPRKND